LLRPFVIFTLLKDFSDVGGGFNSQIRIYCPGSRSVVAAVNPYSGISAQCVLGAGQWGAGSQPPARSTAETPPCVGQLPPGLQGFCTFVRSPSHTGRGTASHALHLDLHLQNAAMAVTTVQTGSQLPRARSCENTFPRPRSKRPLPRSVLPTGDASKRIWAKNGCGSSARPRAASPGSHAAGPRAPRGEEQRAPPLPPTAPRESWAARNGGHQATKWQPARPTAGAADPSHRGRSAGPSRSRAPLSCPRAALSQGRPGPTPYLRSAHTRSISSRLAQ
jgi:hypothetical protein